MINSGVSSCCIHRKPVEQYRLPTTKKVSPKMKIIDKQEISSGLVNTKCKFICKIGTHIEML
jgi:hypothetical protein